MPQFWTPNALAPAAALPAAAVAALIDVAAAPAGAEVLMRAVQALVPMDYLSVVSIRNGQPQLLDGQSERPREQGVVAQCFSIYRRQGYYRHDAILPVAAQMARRPNDGMAVLHCRAHELPDAGWRSEIYDRERLTDRFTLLHAPGGDDVQAIHLYRVQRMGHLSDDDIQRLLALAPLLRQAHAAAWRGSARGQARAAQVLDHDQRLRRLMPPLSPRERAVCARVALGMSADGIATDLDVAPSTVRTLRKRAYQKLAAAGHPADRLGLARLLG